MWCMFAKLSIPIHLQSLIPKDRRSVRSYHHHLSSFHVEVCNYTFIPLYSCWHMNTSSFGSSLTHSQHSYPKGQCTSTFYFYHSHSFANPKILPHHPLEFMISHKENTLYPLNQLLWMFSVPSWLFPWEDTGSLKLEKSSSPLWNTLLLLLMVALSILIICVPWFLHFNVWQHFLSLQKKLIELRES